MTATKDYSFEYYNPDLLEIIYLEANMYGLKVIKFKKISDDTAKVVVNGSVKNIKRFENDLDEDALDWSESERDLDDDEYIKFAKYELKKLGIKTA